jgi:hypothetical protein
MDAKAKIIIIIIRRRRRRRRRLLTFGETVSVS